MGANMCQPARNIIARDRAHANRVGSVLYLFKRSRVDMEEEEEEDEDDDDDDDDDEHLQRDESCSAEYVSYFLDKCM